MSESLQIFTENVEELVQDHAGLTSLLQHWKALSGDRAMPQRQDFDPVDVPELLTGICLVEVIDGGKDYLYRVAGTALEDVSRHRLQNKRFSELDHKNASQSMRTTCEACVRIARPVMIRNQLQEPGRDHLAITAIILPLSEDGETVSMILTMTEFEDAS